MLRGIDFFRRSVALANKYRRPDLRVLHTIQTNGTLIDDEWARFFKQNNYLVGVSIDGPRALHDAYRVDKRGEGSFDDVIRGWNCLRKHKVDVNILCTIHAANADHPLEVYRFFRDELKAAYIQLIPIVERATPETIALANQGWGGLQGADRPLYTQTGNLVTERSVKADKFGKFLIADLRRMGEAGCRQGVRRHLRRRARQLARSAQCLHRLADLRRIAGPGAQRRRLFLRPFRRAGSPARQRAADAARRPRGVREAAPLRRGKVRHVPKYCRECPVLFACYGECPRNRFIATPDGEAGLNYLCEGYKAFFQHIDKPMRTMADLLRHGRYADEIMSCAGVATGGPLPARQRSRAGGSRVPH